MGRHARTGRSWKVRLFVALLAVTALLFGAWTLDAGALSGDVARNVSLVGGGETVNLGGASRARVESVVDDMAARIADTAVTIATGATTYDSSVGSLGLAVDEPATVAAVIDAGRSGSWVARPFSWARSFVAPWKVRPVYQVDEKVLAAELEDLQGEDRVAPVEPSMRLDDDHLELVKGVSGSGLDPAGVATAVRNAAEAGDRPIVVHVEVGALPPQLSDPAAQALVDEANRITVNGLTLNDGPNSVRLEAGTLRSWFAIEVHGDSADLAIDVDQVAEDLSTGFPELTKPAVEAHFDIVDGKPVLQPSQDGSRCCAGETGDTILDALRTGAAAVEITPTVLEPATTTEDLAALGIVEEVGQPDAFGPTTHHAAGEPRVTNIHRIADIVRGHIVKPGETFSVNGFVGERTTANGFVDAPVIYEGEFTHDVGGGVSQFATTLFNAALYAGLDFGEYQSHSIQISRYPAGHEATISYPHPDLEIVNNTPYGILLWPTYTDSSITVHLYSTHYVDVSIGEPSTSPVGACTQWSTPRVRTYVDGHTDTDSIRALYRPGEGVDC